MEAPSTILASLSKLIEGEIDIQTDRQADPAKPAREDVAAIDNKNSNRVAGLPILVTPNIDA